MALLLVWYHTGTGTIPYLHHTPTIVVVPYHTTIPRTTHTTSATMTSLLTSIFGKNDNEYNESTELFANSIVAPQLTTFARPTTDHQPPAQKRSQKDQPAFDPHAQDDRTVFVGNLPANTTRKDLVRAFKACGPIASTRIRSVATQADAAVKLLFQ